MIITILGTFFLLSLSMGIFVATCYMVSGAGIKEVIEKSFIAFVVSFLGIVFFVVPIVWMLYRTGEQDRQCIEAIKRSN